MVAHNAHTNIQTQAAFTKERLYKTNLQVGHDFRFVFHSHFTIFTCARTRGFGYTGKTSTTFAILTLLSTVVQTYSSCYRLPRDAYIDELLHHPSLRNVVPSVLTRIALRLTRCGRCHTRPCEVFPAQGSLLGMDWPILRRTCAGRRGLIRRCSLRAESEFGDVV